MRSKEKRFVTGTGDRYVRCTECNKLVFARVKHLHTCLTKPTRRHSESTVSPRQQDFLANTGNINGGVEHVR